MKKILVTGNNSYVGNGLITWLTNCPNDYSINTISLRDDSWKQESFSGYDVVFHVAGIAHVSTDPSMENQYYKVNRDLTNEVAQKAKKDKVKQFIFMSSIIVYGDSRSDKRIIKLDTIPTPSNFYGNSKLQAEEKIMPLNDANFKVVVVRPPMIYGKDSKGNYPKLSKAAKKLPFFPDFENQRSMLHIDNLSEFIKLMIDKEESGLFFPQNKEYVKTSSMVQMIAETHGRNIRLTKLFNPIINAMLGRVGIINKVFGNLVYEKSMSEYKEQYRVKTMKETIVATEK
ncbi:hypothetical protein JEOAER750_01036 [Jeotgalicoccus aerolatus]|uniref:UDP-glucose 4-epimerase n=1 Tax=Jeotgalicoccus aerolatus TaxID=709510 RepID=A0ABS4HLV4_9STAP|nr:NAD-dependent epimerase/dehydratase family protein [Jeotgalicoccus aerolatus]MBP1951906.1 UDP-glucose 4-epimerase [Jeotgalicoccus aerolatus]GGD93822.1 UDP-glucose 4-epimerase [Jeotgalicoccus aerolatus]CAD2074886.1 hypothetical protein JEOAER750_01036 [Jeotgalicoccus aerolatus]